MYILEIISIIVFPLALGSFQLAIEQGKSPLFDRIGVFRSEEFISIVFFPSLILMIASGIFVFLYSWILLIALFIGTAIFIPLFGRLILLRLWSVPYMLLDKWAQNKIDD
ncbi:MAG: hypothetical protein JRD69_08215 [Deltaproteobacteria bacterium]|nr:hypothetical protein [Deltaproteobacteria bacterium]